jgi:hypothetical protein
MRYVIKLASFILFLAIAVAVAGNLSSSGGTLGSIIKLRNYSVTSALGVDLPPDWIIVYATPSHKLKEGQSVAFSLGGEVGTAKLRETSSEKLVLSGVGEIPHSAAVGRNILRIPFAGSFPAFLKTPLGYIISIGVFLLLLAVSSVLKAVERRREERERPPSGSYEEEEDCR